VQVCVGIESKIVSEIYVSKSTLREKLPEDCDRYYEPFLGGGALFFSLQPSCPVLSDINLNLVRTYAAIKDAVDDVIDLLEKHKSQHCRSKCILLS